MASSVNDIDQKVFSSLSERTLVNGRAVATAPIAGDLGISPSELARALANLADRGWIEVNASAEAKPTAEGHLHLS